MHLSKSCPAGYDALSTSFALPRRALDLSEWTTEPVFQLVGRNIYKVFYPKRKVLRKFKEAPGDCFELQEHIFKYRDVRVFHENTPSSTQK